MHENKVKLFLCNLIVVPIFVVCVFLFLYSSAYSAGKKSDIETLKNTNQKKSQKVWREEIGRPEERRDRKCGSGKRIFIVRKDKNNNVIDEIADKCVK